MVVDDADDADGVDDADGLDDVDDLDNADDADGADADLQHRCWGGVPCLALCGGGVKTKNTGELQSLTPSAIRFLHQCTPLRSRMNNGARLWRLPGENKAGMRGRGRG